MPPDDFIQVAEQSGLIVPIGDWVLRTACRQLASWRSAASRADVRMAVNVSARQLSSPSCPRPLLPRSPRPAWSRGRCASRSPRAPSSKTRRSPSRTSTRSRAGCVVALDDFGVGDYARGVLGYTDILNMVPQDDINRDLFARLVGRRVPFIFVDESQDTFPEVVACLKRGVGAIERQNVFRILRRPNAADLPAGRRFCHARTRLAQDRQAQKTFGPRGVS